MTGEVEHVLAGGDAGDEAQYAGNQECHANDERPGVHRRPGRPGLLYCHRYAFRMWSPTFAGRWVFGAGAVVDGSVPDRLSAVTERTLVLIKPDGVQRRLVGEILGRIEGKGLRIAALELKDVSDDLARRHYAEHEDKPFFGSLLEFITSGPVVAASGG